MIDRMDQALGPATTDAIELRFRGPYSFVPTNEMLGYGDAPDARAPGLYIQGVLLGGRFLASYVGETGGSFVRRLGDEARLWRRGADKRRGQLGELEDAGYSLGNRRYDSRTTDEATTRMRENVLRATRVIIAPSDLVRGERRCVEAEIIRRIKRDSDARDFLYNTPMARRVLDRPLRIILPPGVLVPGLLG